ncbi:MAG: NAD(P)H-hydrate epimerase, partial [Maritimibacter sp.]
MSEVLTAAQMRAIEQAAIESGAVTGLELMERAGQGVVEAVLAEWPELAETSGGAAPTPPRYLETKDKYRAVVLCGPGNNGGDGFVVARLLAERGWAVELFLYGDADKLPPDAKANYQRGCGIGEVSDLDALWDYLPDQN